MTEIRPGIYRHYKGPLYQVLHPVAHDADDPNREVVVYISLQLDAAHLGPRIAVRTAHTFEEMVTGSGKPHDDSVYPETPVRPRFQYLGPVFYEWMLGKAIPLDPYSEEV